MNACEKDPGWQFLRLAREKLLQVFDMAHLDWEWSTGCHFVGTVSALRFEEERVDPRSRRWLHRGRDHVDEG